MFTRQRSQSTIRPKAVSSSTGSLVGFSVKRRAVDCYEHG
jgi:hypothetical protein